MTPRQFQWLWAEYKESLLHTELMHAFTTAALINHSFSPPEKGVTVLDFMPNHPDRLRTSAPAKPLTHQQQSAKDDYMASVVQLTAELKVFALNGMVGTLMKESGMITPERRHE